MEETQPHTPSVMSIQQVAAFLGVSRQHVYKLIHNGLPVVSLGRRTVVLRTSLEEWLLTQQKTTNDL